MVLCTVVIGMATRSMGVVGLSFRMGKCLRVCLTMTEWWVGHHRRGRRVSSDHRHHWAVS